MASTHTVQDGGLDWDALLGRSVAPMDMAFLAAPFAGKRVFITGAGGWIGSALARALAAMQPGSLVLLDCAEQGLYEIDADLRELRGGAPYTAVLGDVCDATLLAEIFSRHRPEIVYHAAACKHVPLMEQNPIAAVRTNAIGTYMLAQAALQSGVERLVLLSTDKAVAPRSIMGASKRAAELVLLALQTAATRMQAVRLGNVLGSRGSVVPLFQKQIAQGGPITVTAPEVRRYFLTLREALALLLLVAQPEHGSGTFIPDLGEQVRILDLARFLMEAAPGPAGREVPIVFTGLRPGDKMEEALLSAGGSFAGPTVGHATRPLRAVQGPHLTRWELAAAMEELQQSICGRNLPSILRTLLRLVPEYQPSQLLCDNGMAPVTTR
ncbi:MAG: polysaccharide biosynthesis protein [Acidobacteriaceae bacterium]